MSKFLAGASTLPTFPTVDMSPTIEWFQNGIVAIFTSNITYIIGLALLLLFMPKIVGVVKRLASKAA